MKRALFFALGCCLLLALAWFVGAKAIAAALTALGVGGLLVAGVLHLPVVVLMALALWYAAGKVGPQTDYLVARVIRDAAADILPLSQLGGFAAGLRVLQIQGQDVVKSALAIFLDLVTEFAAKLPHSAVGLLLLIWLAPDSRLAWPLTLVFLVLVIGSGIAFLFRGRLQVACAAAARRLMMRWTNGGDPSALIAEGFTAKRLLPCFALHLLCWFLGSLETWVVFALLRRPISIAEAVVIDSLANTLRTFAFLIPAAAGVQEGAYVLIGAALGIGAAPAMAFSLARRAREMLIGLPALGFWHLLENRRSAVEHVRRQAQPHA